MEFFYILAAFVLGGVALIICSKRQRGRTSSGHNPDGASGGACSDSHGGHDCGSHGGGDCGGGGDGGGGGE